MVNFGIILFLIGLSGYFYNIKHYIVLLLCVELMILGIVLTFVFVSYLYDDILGQVGVVYLVCLAGIESAIGLGLLVGYYRIREFVVF